MSALHRVAVGASGAGADRITPDRVTRLPFVVECSCGWGARCASRRDAELQAHAHLHDTPAELPTNVVPIGAARPR